MVTADQMYDLERHWNRTIGWMDSDNRGCNHPAAKHTKRVFEMIIEKYTEPHRLRYGCIHILEMLNEYQLRLGGEDYLIMLGIWFHDSIWNPGSKTNKADSIAFMQKCVKIMGSSKFEIERVEKLILATKHDKIEVDFRCKLIADLDIFCLGKPTKEFNADRKLIRKELSRFDEHIYENKTSRFFKRLLEVKPDTIFYNEYFIKEYGARARENILSLIK